MEEMNEDIRKAVEEKYRDAALSVSRGKASCCGEGECADPISSTLYGAGETEGLPENALRASLGCGNPTALATLRPCEGVLDLGSGGGIAGALEESEYRAKLEAAGFKDVSLETTRAYDPEGKFASAFIRAAKPI